MSIKSSIQNHSSSKLNVRKLVLLAVFSAMAFILVLVVNIPIVPGVEFLKYEPKDVIITIGAFLFGPLESILMSVVVSFIEMVSISTTGPIGMIMNIVSTVGFATIAGLIYRKNHTMKGAVAGLICGVVSMTILMLLWNYLITPLYMGVSRETVVQMLMPAFLPFNLIKGVINAAFTMILYKPIVTALRKTGLVGESTTMSKTSSNRSKHIWSIIISVFVLATAALILLVMNHVI